MRRREFIWFLSGAAAWPLEVRAQQPAKIPRIGFIGVVGGDIPATRLMNEAFLLGLRVHGYVEGENIAIIGLNAEGWNGFKIWRRISFVSIARRVRKVTISSL